MVHLLKPAHSEHFMAILDAHYTAWRDALAELNTLTLGAQTW
jgi:hypothetical protein